MRFVCLFLSSLAAVFSWCQKPAVSLSVDTKTAQIGELITFTVKSNVEGSVDIDFPDEFVRGYGTTSGMNQVMDYNTGSVTSEYYFSQNGAFKENGTYTIYAFVKGKKNVYKSNKITIKIQKNSSSVNEDELSKKNLKQPVFGIIKKSKTQLYEGEPLVLESKTYARLPINMLEAYEPFSVEGGAENHELDKSKKLMLSRENYKGTTFLTFTYGKQLVFPNGVGKVKINPFEMSLQYDNGGIFSERVAFTSNAASVEILPLPKGAPTSFIGGVGTFDFSYSISNKNLKKGDVFKLVLTLTGEGNLHNTSRPVLTLPKGFVLYGDPEKEEQIEFSEKGASGQLIYTYHIQIQQAINTEFPAQKISYFDPEKKKYITVSKAGQTLNMSIENAVSSSPISTPPTNSEDNNIHSSIYQNTYQADSPTTSPFLLWGILFGSIGLASVAGLYGTKLKSRLSIPVLNTTHSQKANLALTNFKRVNFQTIPVSDGYRQLEESIKLLGAQFLGENETCNSKLEVCSILAKKQIPEKHIQQIQTVLRSCEEARYSFTEDRNHLLQCAQQLEETLVNIS